MAITLRLRSDQLSKFRAIAGLTTEQLLADRMGLHQGTVNRVLRGRQVPSARFVGALVMAFPGASFDDLWEIAEVSYPDRIDGASVRDTPEPDESAQFDCPARCTAASRERRAREREQSSAAPSTEKSEPAQCWNTGRAL